MGIEQPQKYYNQVFTSSKKYGRHYSALKCFPMFDKAKNFVHGKVLEIGCGTGQFSHLLYDQGIKDYTGFDFSEVAIAKSMLLWKLPYTYIKGNAYDKHWYKDDKLHRDKREGRHWSCKNKKEEKQKV